MGLEEERKKMGDKEGRGGRQAVEEEKKGKEGGLKPDTRNSGPAKKILLRTENMPAWGGRLVSIEAFINAAYSQSLIYNRLRANILQVPLGTSEDRKKSKRN